MSINVEFDKFYLPENIKYTTHWLNSKLYNTRIEDSFGPTNKNMKELPHQTYIRNYFHINSPYRGILLFHGLGTGKSCTSITTAENLKKLHHIFILSPASLQVNWEDEIINICGDSDYKNNINLFYKNYTLIKYNSSDIKNIYISYIYNNYIGDIITFIYNNIKYIGKILDVEGTFTNILYIVDIYTIQINLDIINESGIDNDNILIINSPDIKIIHDKDKNVFSNKVVIIDEIHNLISMYKKDNINYNSPIVLYRNRTYVDLIDSINSKIILLSGTPVINSVVELKYILNILHGKNEFIIFKLNILDNTNIDINDLHKYILENNNYINAIDIKYEKSIITINILKLIDYFKKQDNYVVKINYIYTNNNLIDDITKLFILYFNKNNVEYNLLEILPIYKRNLIELNDIDFETTFVDKEYNNNFELNIKDIKNELFLKTLMIGKISYLQSEKSTQLIEHNLNLVFEQDQYTIYIMERDKEISYGMKALKNSDDTSKLRASSRQMCLIGIKGLNIDIDVDYDNNDNDNDNDNDNNDNIKLSLIDKFIKKISKNKNKLDSVIKNYSIKYYTLINILNNKKDINYLEGKVLIYSEYRELGVKLIGTILEYYNYKSLLSYFTNINQYFINNKLSDDGKLLIHKELLNIKNHYLIYSIYNANTSNKYLRHNVLMKYIYDLPENDNGKYMRILFITKSGSEGLSFKTIRQIHIMDPFWHLTRKKQVIGRGIRFGSHDRLPSNKRNVHVYNYISTFPTNIKLSDNIIKYDKSLTTDEYIINSATKKQIIIDKLYNIIKSVSIDCPFNFDNNYNIKCINYPLKLSDNINIYNPFTYTFNKQEYINTRAKLIILDNIKYICYNNNIYNYDIYQANNSYIKLGTYYEINNTIEFKILNNNIISLPINIKTFEQKGIHNIHPSSKIYIYNININSNININNDIYTVINKNDKYLIINNNNNNITLKKYIYNDSTGFFILNY